MAKADKTKRIFLLIFIILFALALFVLPHIELKGARKRIAGEASSKLKAKVVISHAYLSLFPWPHITLKGIRIESPQWGGFISEEMRVYPRLAPLFKKEVALKRLFLKGPTLDLTLAEGAMTKGKGTIIPYLKKRGVRKIPSLEVEGGRVNILRPGEKNHFFKIQALEGNIVPRKKGEVELGLQFSCSGAARVELKGKGDPALGRGWFNLIVEGISLDKLISLIRREEITIVSSRMDLGVHGEAKGWDKIRLQLEGGDFQIILADEEGGREEIRGDNWEGVIKREGNLWSGKIGPLELLSPSLRVSAWAKEERGESFSFIIKGIDVKVEEVRRVVLKLMGKDETVKEIFHILQGGEVSQIVCYGEGKDLREAVDVEHNMRIRGTLSEGKVLVPAGPLPLEEVSGEVLISQAVMQGWGIEARLGRSIAKEGKLVIGLTAERDIFHLEAEVEADAGDIVHYLPMVLKEELRLGIKRFQEANGWAHGRLVLGENIHAVDPRVEVEDFQVSFNHELFPWPISLEGGDLALQDGVLTWKGVKGKLGRSTLYHGAGSISLLGDKPSLEISSLAGDVDLEDVDKWLKGNLGLKSIRGDLKLEDLRFKAVLNPFRAEGISFHGRCGDGAIYPSFSSTPFFLKGVEVICNDGLSLKESGDGRPKPYGELILRADTITWEDYIWRDAEGVVTFGDKGTSIKVARADLCGINCQGTISQGEGMTTLAFRFWARGAGPSPTISCLWGKDAHIEGTFLLEGDIKAEGKEDPLRESSQGSLLIRSQKGRIYRWTILSRIFSLLNVMEFFKGKFPDFTQKGFQYDKFIIKGDLKDGSLCLEEAVIDGTAMKIVGEGKIDLLKGEANLVVLIAPLKTVDIIMNNIPIFGKVFTGKSGTFISVPFGVTGPLDDPKITTLPPSAVGAGLWGLLKRTLQVPGEVIKPVLPKK
ncbi:MAG: AsmA-like C-terminal domain-containing protein [Deltaproteobacteria bacterium]|nr:AsmA-like C-terminal domain-containing protein [Deltaproteobacteria bacterium]